MADQFASFLWARAAYAKAEPLYQRALVIFEKALGLDHPDVATSLNNLAGLYRVRGQYAPLCSETRRRPSSFVEPPPRRSNEKFNMGSQAKIWSRMPPYTTARTCSLA
jgi:Tetratricopeptide repeat